MSSWTLSGFDGQPIFGNVHRPQGRPHSVVLIAHGFKGYKDYGMFPRIAAKCAAAGFIAHRFNFSHSGMTSNLATFGRPDLFERDTWNKQVFDLRAVINAAIAGSLRDHGSPGLPHVLFGHSRGGVAALLTAGRFADDPTFAQPAAVITAAAPSSCNFLSPEEARQLMEQGFLVSPSSRTGQALRIGKAFLQEQLDDPTSHDLLALVQRIHCPILLIHGDRDPTVPLQCANEIAAAAKPRAETMIIRGADHVFNTPNPMPEDGAPSPQLQELIDAMIRFTRSAVGV